MANPDLLKTHQYYVESFLTDLSVRSMSPHTIATYKSVLLTAITMLSDKPISQWSGIDYNAFLLKSEQEFNERRKASYARDFQEGQYQYKKYTPRTRMLKANALRSFINFCLDENLIPSSALKFRKIREQIDQKFQNRVPYDEMVRFIKAIPKKRHRVMFMFQFGMLLRVSELVKVRFSDIDWERRILKVRGKGNKYREVPFDKSTLSIIFDYICEFRFHINVPKIHLYYNTGQRRKISESDKMLYQLVKDRDLRLFRTERFNVAALKDQFIFLAKANKPYIGTSSLHKILDNVNRDGQYSKKITSHFMRGNGACERHKRGAILERLQRYMGHSSPNTTEGYLDDDLDELRKTTEETAFLDPNMLM